MLSSEQALSPMKSVHRPHDNPCGYHYYTRVRQLASQKKEQPFHNEEGLFFFALSVEKLLDTVTNGWDRPLC